MKKKVNKKDIQLGTILLVLFSISLALGSFNPLNPNAYEDESSGVGLVQVISVVYIFFMILVYKCKTKFISWRVPLCVFFVVITLTTLLQYMEYQTFGTYMNLIKLFLVVLLCLYLPRVFEKDKNKILLSIIVYTITCSVIAVAYMLGLMEEYVRYNGGRLFLFGENPNSMSSRYVLAVIFLVHLLLKNPMRLNAKRWLSIIMLVPLVYIIIASGSRGSFLIIMFCVCMYVFFSNFRNKLVKPLFCLVILLSGLYIVNKIAESDVEFSLFERLSDTAKSGDDAGRGELNKMAYDIFMDSPIFGVGIQGFTVEMNERFRERLTVHNLYMYILATSGIVGFVAFTLFVLSLLKYSIAIRKKDFLPFILMLFIILLVYKTGGALTYMLMWYVFSINISLISNNMNIEKYKV
ncbi:MAG: O-antigen ligase family protein [Bacteroidales bacterium]|nr:O-antigen ligase family protein [Bacteroidales bacterium]